MTHTTPTRDEAVPALSEIPASVVVAMSKRLGAVEPFNDLSDDDIAAMFRDGLAAYLASSAAPASGGVDAVAVNEHGIMPCKCGSYPTPYKDGATPDDGYRLLWCDGCKADVTEWHQSEAEAISAWNEKREIETGATSHYSATQLEEIASLSPAATPVSEAEPVGKIVWFEGVGNEVSWSKGRMPPAGTKLYALAKPASSPAGVAREALLLARSAIQSCGDPAKAIASIDAALQSTSAGRVGDG